MLVVVVAMDIDDAAVGAADEAGVSVADVLAEDDEAMVLMGTDCDVISDVL